MPVLASQDPWVWGVCLLYTRWYEGHAGYISWWVWGTCRVYTLVGIVLPGVYPGIMVGIVLPGVRTGCTMVGIHLPVYAGTTLPWVYHGPPPAPGRTVLWVHRSWLPDDEALGSPLRIIWDMRRIVGSRVPKVW